MVYIAFCPLDITIDLTTTSGNINFALPKYPTYFTSGFPLKPILSYGFSDH